MASYLHKRRVVNNPTSVGDALPIYDWTVGCAAEILTVIDDGMFRSRKQITKATGMGKGSVDGTLHRLMRLGGIERRANPKYDRWEGGFAEKPVSKFLYRITDKGRKRKPPAS
jgi:hypothetical protein